ncbi:MGC131027 protein, related [Eimeria acervulina]|uniref:MGC131027 protein, related n=1 Tax=Eimeria acervulina TaxID=5801 RepID=U6GBJ3_EIMAC|nr:MGC131027 protein, related [Eimeria acervulina]CDI76912.1 MGC131027 protein, related [Eimeria acervulina]
MFGLHYRMCFRCQANILAYDYSGYGWSDGEATENAVYADIRKVVYFAVHSLHVPLHRIILYGHSVGSGPSCDIAAKGKMKDLGGIILHSSIASGLRLFINNIEKAPWFDAFQNAEKLKKVRDVPLLLIHGRLDRQVPFAHSLKLEASCREADARYEQQQQQQQQKSSSSSRCCFGSSSQLRKTETPQTKDAELRRHRVQTWWVPDADHNDVEHKAGDEYYRRISAFLAFCAKWHADRDAKIAST